MSTSSFDPARTSPSLLIRVRDPAGSAGMGGVPRALRPDDRGWCRHWFPRETEDMVQEVLLLLVGGLRTFEYEPGRGRFRGYLKTVTNRLMADLKETSGAAAVVDDDGLDQEVEAARTCWPAGGRVRPGAAGKAKEVRGRVEARTWSAYVETAEQGRKPAEVARELGMKVGAVFQAKHSVITLLAAGSRDP